MCSAPLQWVAWGGDHVEAATDTQVLAARHRARVAVRTGPQAGHAARAANTADVIHRLSPVWDETPVAQREYDGRLHNAVEEMQC